MLESGFLNNSFQNTKIVSYLIKLEYKLIESSIKNEWELSFSSFNTTKRQSENDSKRKKFKKF